MLKTVDNLIIMFWICIFAIVTVNYIKLHKENLVKKCDELITGLNVKFLALKQIIYPKVLLTILIKVIA